MKHEMKASNTMISVVNSYLKTRALAELLRDEVDKIKAEVLAEYPLYDKDGNRITEVRRDYRAADDGEFQEYLNIINERCRAAGIKPDTMPDEYCPALVAEDSLRKIEHLIVETSASEFKDRVPDLAKVTVNGLLCLGLEKYKKFIDLVVGFTVNASNFERCEI